LRCHVRHPVFPRPVFRASNPYDHILSPIIILLSGTHVQLTELEDITVHKYTMGSSHSHHSHDYHHHHDDCGIGLIHLCIRISCDCAIHQYHRSSSERDPLVGSQASQTGAAPVDPTRAERPQRTEIQERRRQPAYQRNKMEAPPPYTPSPSSPVGATSKAGTH
jgi:hypothetical protein